MMKALVNDDVIPSMSHFIAASRPCVLWKRNPSQTAYVAFLIVLFIFVIIYIYYQIHYDFSFLT